MFVSAVESSTAVGTLETWIPWGVQAETSTWSYPAPGRVQSLAVLTDMMTQERRCAEGHWRGLGKVFNMKCR